jgi:rare lipoprotein A
MPEPWLRAELSRRGRALRRLWSIRRAEFPIPALFSNDFRVSARMQSAKGWGSFVKIAVLSVACVGALAVSACAAVPAASGQTGTASIYGYGGGPTASGETAIPGRLTAAHRSLPFGTRVRVTNRKNGRSVVVRINDRGPFIRGRVIDVTPAAARALGFSGLTPVALAIVAD